MAKQNLIIGTGEEYKRLCRIASESQEDAGELYLAGAYVACLIRDKTKFSEAKRKAEEHYQSYAQGKSPAILRAYFSRMKALKSLASISEQGRRLSLEDELKNDVHAKEAIEDIFHLINSDIADRLKTQEKYIEILSKIEYKNFLSDLERALKSIKETVEQTGEKPNPRYPCVKKLVDQYYSQLFNEALESNPWHPLTKKKISNLKTLLDDSRQFLGINPSSKTIRDSFMGIIDMAISGAYPDHRIIYIQKIEGFLEALQEDEKTLAKNISKGKISEYFAKAIKQTCKNFCYSWSPWDTIEPSIELIKVLKRVFQNPQINHNKVKSACMSFSKATENAGEILERDGPWVKMVPEKNQILEVLNMVREELNY